MSAPAQSFPVIVKDDLYVLNHCTKFLARENVDQRHNYGQFPPGDPRGNYCEPWRFPIIDSYYDGKDYEKSYRFNEVTFVFFDKQKTPENISVVGSFCPLYASVPLSPVRFQAEETGYYSVTVMVPKAQVHTYKFIVDGEARLDPINPQQVVLDNGETWSRFFTHLCTQPICLERDELIILGRLIDHILPFRTPEGERFLQYFYDYLDKSAKEQQYAHAYRLDQSVGVVNFIDKILAREEFHHLIDYKICLELIDKVLRKRNPYVEPGLMSMEIYIELYNQMASNNVPDWDYQRYQSPQYFLQLLRRHTISGAFSHPKYGGNVGGAGWAYLSERYVDKDTKETLFNWRKAVEKPLGLNEDYWG